MSEWWRGAVIYQIYPRSFLDSNSDGIGDLPGIIAKLDYIASLGVDGIWISPFFTSPMQDFGYDVSNYRDVDPMFGTLEDFKTLVAKAHQLGLKVLIDQVMSHTSDQHPWFIESRASRDNPKADWYVWADAKPDGCPPNNWLSIFGGSGWQWEPRREQYYLHNFLVSQPDLNFHNPEVRKQILEETEFWLKLGADGLRLDTVNFYFHDAKLRDNPAFPKDAARSVNAPQANPYTLQQHLYDVSQPENLAFLQDIRRLLDKYDGAAVGEIGDDHPLQTMAAYTSGNDKLQMAYTFNLLTDKSDVPYLKDVISTVNSEIGDGWPCWALSNHDVPRCITRWGKGAPAEKIAPVYLALLLSLRGSACIYQGEELALVEAEVAFEDLQDPYGKPFWPEYKGRDGCRTPLPWQQHAPYGGFSESKPWLPMYSAHLPFAQAEQEKNPASPLQRYRQFIHWRKQHPALIVGDLELLDSTEDCIVLIRSFEDKRILVAINIHGTSVQQTVPPGMRLEPLYGHGFHGSHQKDHIELGAYDAFFAELINH